MKTILNNEGRQITVSEHVYSEIKLAGKQGNWMVLIEVNGQPHMVPTQQ